MIETVGIADQGVRHGTQIEQAVPVGIVACQTRDFEAQHNAYQSHRNGGNEAGKSGTLVSAGTGQAEIFVDDGDLFAWPAQFNGAISQRILPFGGFTIVFHLRRRRLAHVDEGVALQMGWFDFATVSHDCAPHFGWLSLPAQSAVPAPRRRPFVVPRSAIPTRRCRGSVPPECPDSVARWRSFPACLPAPASSDAGSLCSRASTIVRACSNSESGARLTPADRSATEVCSDD